MALPNYICINGEYINSENPVLFFNNRAFLYGDGLFETVHANGTDPQFFDNHYARLLSGIKLLKMEVPGNFDKHFLIKQIKGVLTRNKQFQGARVRISVFRNEGGKYTPETNKISYLIESSSLEFHNYRLNQHGFNINVYPELSKPINFLSGVKSVSALLYVQAGLFRLENKLDECIILNEKGRVCETISSNIFIIKNDKISTPGLLEGCLPGIMREAVVELLHSNNFEVESNSSVTVDNLFEADEVFITNAINGIRWILAFRQKRYYNKFSKKLIELLNDKAFGKS